MLYECDICHQLKTEDDMERIDSDRRGVCRHCAMVQEQHAGVYDSPLVWVYREDAYDDD